MRNPPYVNKVLISEFKTQEDVGMYVQLPDYDGFRGFDLPNEMVLVATPVGILRPLRRIRGWRINIIYLVRKFIRSCLKQYAQMRRMVRCIQERVFRRVAEIHTSRTPNYITGMDIVDLWRSSNFSPFARYFSALLNDSFYRN